MTIDELMKDQIPGSVKITSHSPYSMKNSYWYEPYFRTDREWMCKTCYGGFALQPFTDNDWVLWTPPTHQDQVEFFRQKWGELTKDVDNIAEKIRKDLQREFDDLKKTIEKFNPQDKQ